LIIPASTVPGTNYIGILVDRFNEVAESNENNNYVSSQIIIDDNYEPNNDMASAYYLSSYEQTWLSTIDGYGGQADDDWYEICLSSGFEHVVVNLQFTHDNGDLDLALVDASGSTLATSTSTTDDEYIDYTVSSPGVYYIRVNSFDFTSNTYDLWWDDISP
jgi:hypothetical protein